MIESTKVYDDQVRGRQEMLFKTHFSIIKNLLAILLVVGMITCATAPVEAASKAPAKPKITKLSLSSSTVTLKWKKAKRAKKYQVYIKENKGKYKLKKTLKKRTYSFKGKYGATYSIKIRGVNGKKKGKYSKVKKITIRNATTESVINKVAGYSYNVRPIILNFNYVIYVETDNPDPTSFRLKDTSSKYVTESADDSGTFVLDTKKYVDVVYENKVTNRVKGGYIFYDYYCQSDGGKLVVQAKSKSGFVNTDKTVNCTTLTATSDYLLDTYTNGSMTFFQKLDAVQAALKQISVYPRSIQNTSLINKERPYPFLASSPYQEIGLNEHYEMYLRGDEGVFLRSYYPFVLDSLGTPGTMRALAKKLNKNAEVSSVQGDHSIVEVSLNGETRCYGGQGNGSSGPLYTRYVDSFYSFTGDADDMSINTNLNDLYAKLMKYGENTTAELKTYKDQLTKEPFAQAIGGGSWIRIATEGFGYGQGFAYVPYDPIDPNYPWIPANVWVDGRYIGMNEIWVKDAKFEDHPTASIIIRNVSYVDKNGRQHKNDIKYKYNHSLERWTAPNYYTDSSVSYGDSNLEKPFYLTKEEVDAMNMDSSTKLDRNTGAAPAHGLVYDGTKEPGTPF